MASSRQPEPHRGHRPQSTRTSGHSAADELRTSATSDYEYPRCRNCHQGWSWPRNIRYIGSGSSTAHGVKPRTKSTIVPYLSHHYETGAFTVCPQLFTQLHLVYTRTFRHHALVTDFWFEKTSGRVFYERPGENIQGFLYARLITLNSWWRDLARSLLQTIMQFGDFTSNMLFIADILEDQAMSHLVALHLLFTMVFCIIVFSWFCVATAEATKEWRMKSHPNIGDVTRLAGRADEWLSFAAVVIFMFFGVDTQIMNVVIQCHPWKGFQQYAALKSQGTRAHVVCFADESFYKIENWSGQFIILPLRFVMTVIASAYKVYILSVKWQDPDAGPQLFMLTTIMTSFVTSIFTLRKFLALRKARREWWKQRKAIKVNESSGAAIDWRDRMIEYRHFNVGPLACIAAMCGVIVSPIISWIRKDEKPVDENCCVWCGRPGEDSGRMERRKNAVPQNIGDLVMLNDAHKQSGDARWGVLREGDLGKVVKKGEFVTGYGHRVLVQRVQDNDNGGNDVAFESSWWYDCCDLRKATDEEGFIGQAYKVEDRVNEEAMRKIHALCGEIRKAGLEISQEMMNFTGEADRSAAADMIKMAIADAVDPAMLPAGSHSHMEIVSPGVSPSADASSPVTIVPKPTMTLSLAAFANPDEALAEDTSPPDVKVSLEDAPEEPEEVLTPREAEMRKRMMQVADQDSQHAAASASHAFSGLKSRALVKDGKKRYGLAVLGGLTIDRPDAAEMLKHLAHHLSRNEILQMNLAIVTAANQGVEQKLTEACDQHMSIVNLVPSNLSVRSKKGVDIVAGETYNTIRQALNFVADIFIVVEGEKSAANAAGLAFQRGAKVIPVSKYGGAAARVPQEVLDKPDWAQKDDWDALSSDHSSRRTAQAIVRLVEQALRNL